MYLRARWYLAETGTFLSRDPVENEPPYAYVRGNPVNNLDSSGLYGVDVHNGLTFGLALDAALNTLTREDAVRLAHLVATGDQHVDDAVGILDAVIGCNDCHFAPMNRTLMHVEEAIRRGNPFLFGATLHQYQDWYSHWGEGYNTLRTLYVVFGTATFRIQRYEHVYHSEFGENRDPEIFKNPFFERHPRKLVEAFVSSHNPGLSLASLNDDELIDLYLRNFGLPSDTDRFQERFSFRFYTDRYIEGSNRDLAMKVGTKMYIQRFISRNLNPCQIKWEIPSDSEIRELLRK